MKQTKTAKPTNETVETIIAAMEKDAAKLKARAAAVAYLPEMNPDGMLAEARRLRNYATRLTAAAK